MNIILGANGHVGSAAANALLKGGEPVTVVVHDPETRADWEEKGATAISADVNDTEAMKAIFGNGDRVFLLNPPAPPSTDTAAVEQRSVAALLLALRGSGITKVVAESTYGAQPGEGIGDLGVLYKMEQGLKELDLPVTILRAAYYMSNWEMSLESARREGMVHTLYPIEFKLPMVSPRDLGLHAARYLLEPTDATGTHFVEGPEEYSPQDVADAFAEALGKPVRAVETPRSGWVTTLQSMGFSNVAAHSMAKMTDLTLEGGFDRPEHPERGTETLRAYIRHLVATK